MECEQLLQLKCVSAIVGGKGRAGKLIKAPRLGPCRMSVRFLALIAAPQMTTGQGVAGAWWFILGVGRRFCAKSKSDLSVVSHSVRKREFLSCKCQKVLWF